MRRFLVAALLLALLALPARAVDAALYGADGLREGLDARTDVLLEDADPTRSDNFSTTMRTVLRDALQGLPDAVRGAARTLSVLLAIVLLCALAGNVQGGVSKQAAALAGALAVTGACTVNLQAMIALARETISQVSVFSELLLPVLSSVIAAAGAGICPRAAAAFCAGRVDAPGRAGAGGGGRCSAGGRRGGALPHGSSGTEADRPHL